MLHHPLLPRHRHEQPGLRGQEMLAEQERGGEETSWKTGELRVAGRPVRCGGARRPARTERGQRAERSPGRPGGGAVGRREVQKHERRAKIWGQEAAQRVNSRREERRHQGGAGVHPDTSRCARSWNRAALFRQEL